ncbi:hypothetical protein SCA6_017058 [Theobroma cacao]
MKFFEEAERNSRRRGEGERAVILTCVALKLNYDSEMSFYKQIDKKLANKLTGIIVATSSLVHGSTPLFIDFTNRHYWSLLCGN